MIQEIITKVFRTMVQTHIYHWLTDSHQVHTILGKLYADLQKVVDPLAESYLSYDNTLSGDVTLDISYSYSNEELINVLVECREMISNAIDQEENNSIENALVGILSILDTNIYLLGMIFK